MKRQSKIASAILIATAGMLAHAATPAAESYPVRPIRFVVGFLPGGPSDTIGRVVGGKLGETLGQTVVIDNRAGAGGNLSAEIVADAQPDGYTLLLGTGGPLVIAPIIGQKVGFDADKDFAPVTKLGNSMSILAAHPSLPAKNVQELIALARTKPGDINYASSGVTGAGRSSAVPDVPTIAEQGLPGYEVNSWYGLFVPAKTPKAVIARLNTGTLKVLALPEVKARLAHDGVEAEGSTPEQLAALVRAERKLWAKVIKDANIKIQ